MPQSRAMMALFLALLAAAGRAQKGEHRNGEQLGRAYASELDRHFR